VASNYLVALIDVSLELFSRAGVDRKAALAALERLIAATAANAAALGVPFALTGPIDRGDEATIRSHLAAIRALPADPDRERIEAIYRTLGLRTLELAREKRGAFGPGHERIERMLLHEKEHQ